MSVHATRYRQPVILCWLRSTVSLVQCMHCRPPATCMSAHSAENVACMVSTAHHVSAAGLLAAALRDAPEVLSISSQSDLALQNYAITHYRLSFINSNIWVHAHTADGWLQAVHGSTQVWAADQAQCCCPAANDGIPTMSPCRCAAHAVMETALLAS